LGVSRGGQIATDFTLEHPEMVDGLVLVAAGLGGFEGGDITEEEKALLNEMEKLWEAKEWDRLSEMEMSYWLNGPAQPKDRVPAELRDKVRGMIHYNYSNQPYEGKPRVLTPPAAGRLGEIKVPTLIIVGDLDESLMPKIADTQAEGIAGAKKVIMHGTAHLPNMERPEEFNRIVLDFLGGIGA
ncbi:MAG: alpha/beta hydrolase, partial [Chloroflexota bacterium]|nr:alpha/beta hydrolase [Chloroflexota bacterium]